MSLSTDLLEVWGAAMWCASWQGGLVALAVWSVCRFAPSMPARFQSWLWRLVMLKFMVALLWSVPIELPLLPASTLTETFSVTLEASELSLLNSIPTEGSTDVERHPFSVLTPLRILFLAWIVFVAWQAARILTACRNANRLRNRCRQSENKSLMDELATLSKAAGLRSPPTLLETDGQGSPLLLGIFQPAIVLPATTLSRLDAVERTLVLGHELAHIRRADLFWSVVASVVQGVFFFHPLVWIGERQLRLTQEIAADELAITLERHDPISYATVLVSVVSKLGPDRLLPAMCVGMAGSQQSLKQRFSAMRFMKPVSRRIVMTYGIVLGLVAVLAIVPWAVVAVDAKTNEQKAAGAIETSAAFVKSAEYERTSPAEFKIADAIDITLAFNPPDVKQETAQAKPAPKEKTERGRFVSFQNGTLTIKANSGVLLENKISDNTKTFQWNDAENLYKPADTAEALQQIKVETWCIVHVANDNVTLRIGSRKGKTIGTFVSFKDNRLLVLGKNLGESFTKKYGNNVHFNKFREDVPIYESIDGGDYQLVTGAPGRILANVKEGTVLTIHGEGDDNITLIQIGVPKAK